MRQPAAPFKRAAPAGLPIVLEAGFRERGTVNQPVWWLKRRYGALEATRLPAPRCMCINSVVMHTRTNIVIDDRLIAEALSASGARTKRQAVEQGLRLLVQVKRQSALRRLRGDVDWRGDLDAMRRD